MSNVIVFGAIVLLALLTGWLLAGESISNTNRRIDADIAFLRAIPGDDE